MLDVVYYCRAGANEELRYSLRSLANLPHGRVWVVGDRPAWLTGVEFVKGNRMRTKEANEVDNLRLACDALDASRFVVMNDDFYVMEALSGLPSLHDGPLAERIRTAGSGYRKQLRLARERLTDHPEPVAWTLHIPVEVEREGLALVLRLIASAIPPEWRTMYGNLARVEGTQAPDVKVRRRSDPIPDGPFLSSADGTFTTVLPLLRQRFPDPSRYETT